jgi:hypothetical protein
MIDDAKLLVLFKEDLIHHSEDKPFEEIDLMDFRVGVKQFLPPSIVMFIDYRSGHAQTRILKNRWGNEGKVVHV